VASAPRLLAALLFGAGTPLAKWLMGDVQPWMLAGLCYYLGSGLGLGLLAARLRGCGTRCSSLPASGRSLLA